MNVIAYWIVYVYKNIKKWFYRRHSPSLFYFIYKIKNLRINLLINIINLFTFILFAKFYNEPQNLPNPSAFISKFLDISVKLIITYPRESKYYILFYNMPGLLGSPIIPNLLPYIPPLQYLY